MYASVGIEPQWLSASTAGSARFLLSCFPSSSSFSSSYGSWACRSRVTVKVVRSFPLKKASQKGRCDVGKSILNGGGIWVPRKVHLQSGDGRYCGEEFPARAAYGGLLRPLSSLSSRATRISAPAAPPLTEGVRLQSDCWVHSMNDVLLCLVYRLSHDLVDNSCGQFRPHFILPATEVSYVFTQLQLQVHLAFVRVVAGLLWFDLG